MRPINTPDRIYLQVCGDCNENECKNCKFEDLEDNVTWCRDKIFEKDIEYVNANNFIKKACKWLRKELVNFEDYNGMGEEFIRDFKKFMNIESQMS